jgi:tRNA pseudouridine55 synthase
VTDVNGVLVLHKPAGMTSHDCVARVRRLFHTRKVGHAGTLDPDVTGVLPVCLGQATRVIEYLQDVPKAYEVQMTLGASTTTEDASGEIIRTKPVEASSITEERVREVLQSFVGTIEQVPPMYSALKVNGKRLYEWAREGREVERKARTVAIYQLLLRKIEGKNREQISFYCQCSKGTYMRTLCVDLGEALGYPAHMSGLVRVSSGSFSLADAITLEELERRLAAGEPPQTLLRNVSEALSFLPKYELPESRVEAVRNGLSTALSGMKLPEGTLVRLEHQGELIGIHRVCYGPKGAFAKAEKVFRNDTK